MVKPSFKRLLKMDNHGDILWRYMGVSENG